MADLSDLLRIAGPAAGIYCGSHITITLARAYIRYKLTENEHPGKGFLERMPRCFAKRIVNPDTFEYSTLLWAIAATVYYIAEYAR